MYLAYVDDAGDAGIVNSPTAHLVLGAVLVHESEWLEALDGLIGLRSKLYAQYGLSKVAQVRARDFARGGGPFRGLHLGGRSRARMLSQIFHSIGDTLPVRVFAVAVHKAPADANGWAPQQAAWTFLAQRLQRFAEEKDQFVMVLTEADLIAPAKRLIRHMRRHHRIPFHRGEGDRRVDLRRVVEDPLEAPEDGYWWQLADWIAHSALRSKYVEPGGKTEHLWDLLGTTRIEEVSQLKKGPPGIVLYP